MKNSRQEAICDIIRTTSVGTQSELCEHLLSRGFSVTQTTVSRDIKELQLVKVPADDGSYRYTLPGAGADTEKYTEVFRNSIISVTAATGLVVVKTAAGAALLTAQAVDALGYACCLGTIAGYDTVFIATSSSECSQKMKDELMRYVNPDLHRS